MFFSPDMRDWVRKDDRVHFVIEAVEKMDLRVARVNVRGSGSEQYPPSVMTALLIYCYAHGIFSSRKIEMATYRAVAVRYLTGDTHPDHDTIATCRRRNRQFFEQCFVQVLAMAGEVGVLQVGTESIDGTKLAGNAQAVVDADGSQLVLGARVSTCASDRNELMDDLETIPPQLGKPNGNWCASVTTSSAYLI